MVLSDDNDRPENGSGGRKGVKRSRNNHSDGEDALRNKSISKDSRKRLVRDDSDDSEHGETEFGSDNDQSDSLVKTTPKSKIETVARKKNDGGKEDVTSKSSSPTRLITNILKGVHKLKKSSSPSDVRSSRTSQDPSKVPQDGANKVPKKSKAQVPDHDANKSLLANISKRSPAEEPKFNSRPISRPPSRPLSRPQNKPEQPKEKTPPNPANAEGTTASASVPQSELGQTTSQKPTRSKSYKMIETVVVKNLQELCSATRLVLPPNNTRQRIDLAGSFFPQHEMQNFFETNESGEIVLHPRIPIFPEDFSSGMKEHDLSWWGIADQTVETKQTFPKVTNLE